MEIIFKRRSIRKYKPDNVSDELVKELLRAGMSAPSAGNAQPWAFIIINKREILDKIPEIHPYSLMIRQAPVAILVCADVSRERYEGFFPQDCSAAVQNILLESTDKGLGTVWLGIYPNKEWVKNFRKMFNLPQNLIPFALIPVGYANEEHSFENRYDESRIYYNQYQD